MQLPLFSAAGSVTANTPMQIGSSCTCAVMQHQCTAALSRAKGRPHCSVLLCKTGSQQAVCQCKYTHEVSLFIQVCSDTTLMHCSSVEGEMQSPLFSAGLQIRLTAGSVSLQIHLWRLLYIQVCSDPATMHCSSVQGKMQSPLFRAVLQIRLTAGSMSLQIHPWNFTIHTGVQ